MKLFSIGFVTLLLISFHSLTLAADPAAIPLSYRSISLSPEALTQIFPQGVGADDLDAAVLKRLDSAIQQKQAVEVVNIKRTVQTGKEEKCEDYKRLTKDGLEYHLGYFGAMMLLNDDKEGSYSLNVSMIIAAAGSYGGPKDPGANEPMNKRNKNIKLTSDLRSGSPKVIAVLPPCPTDGNKNTLITVVALGNPGTASTREKAGSSPSGQTLGVEVFMFPAGTTQQPDVATLEKLRTQGKERVSQIQMRLGARSEKGSVESVTQLCYATIPGRNEVQNIGLVMATTTDGPRTEMRLSYSTLLTPYTQADYNKAMNYKLKKTETVEDFTQKFSPHILRAENKFSLENGVRKTVVPLPVSGFTIQREGTSNLPLCFALVTSTSD